MDKMSFEDKRKKVDALFQNLVPDEITVFSADIVAAPKRKRGYKSGSYADLDALKLLSGAKARVIASAEAAKYFPNAKIITNTRDRDLSRGRPTHARIYAEEQVDLGVSPERIELQEESINTLTELIETVKRAAERGRRIVAVISNSYQLDRIQDMYNDLPQHARELVYPDTDSDDDNAEYTKFMAAYEKFTSSGGRLVLVCAEDLLVIRNPRYAPFVREVKGGLAHHLRDLQEARGRYMLRTRQYRKENRKGRP